MFWKKKVCGKAYRQRRDGAVWQDAEEEEEKEAQILQYFFVLRKTFVLKSENTEFMEHTIITDKISRQFKYTYKQKATGTTSPATRLPDLLQNTKPNLHRL